jgi:hypothetical protein
MKADGCWATTIQLVAPNAATAIVTIMARNGTRFMK